MWQTSSAGTKPATAEASPSGEEGLRLVEGFGKGIAADVKEKSKYYVSDITDGFSIKVSR